MTGGKRPAAHWLEHHLPRQQSRLSWRPIQIDISFAPLDWRPASSLLPCMAWAYNLLSLASRRCSVRSTRSSCARKDSAAVTAFHCCNRGDEADRSCTVQRLIFSAMRSTFPIRECDTVSHQTISRLLAALIAIAQRLVGARAPWRIIKAWLARPTKEGSSSYACSRRIAAYLVLTALDIPPNNGSTVAVRVVDHCIRWHGYPVGRGTPRGKVARIEAHPIAVMADVFFGVYAIGLSATVRAVLRVPLRVEPFANGGVYISKLSWILLSRVRRVPR